MLLSSPIKRPLKKPLKRVINDLDRGDEAEAGENPEQAPESGHEHDDRETLVPTQLRHVRILDVHVDEGHVGLGVLLQLFDQLPGGQQMRFEV